MKVFKFGGASVRSADAVRNMSSIVKMHQQDQLIIIVSSMDKTTNLLETIYSKQFNHTDFNQSFDELTQFHKEIVRELMGDRQMVDSSINTLFTELRKTLRVDYKDYSFGYDQMICLENSYPPVSSTITWFR